MLQRLHCGSKPPATFSFVWAAGLHLTTVVHMLCVTPRTHCRFHDRRLDLFCAHNRVTQHVQRPLPSEGQVLCAAIASQRISIRGPLRPALSGTLSTVYRKLHRDVMVIAVSRRLSL
jgi:hypothetical protein